MPGIELHAQFANERSGIGDGLKPIGHQVGAWLTLVQTMSGRRVRPGMNLADGRTDRSRGSDLILIGINEDADLEPCGGQVPHRSLHLLALSDNIQTALGGHLESAFRNKHHHLGSNARCDPDHFSGWGHFQIEVQVGYLRKRFDIGILYVTAVFTKVNGDSIRTCAGCFLGGENGVGFIRQASLPNGGDVIDVDTEIGHENSVPFHYGNVEEAILE